MRALLFVLLVTSCAGHSNESAPEDAGPTQGPLFLCGLHTERGPCELDQSCIWAESDDGRTWCLPRPDDCRVNGCDEGVCVQDGRGCIPQCTGPSCCVPVHHCLHVDGGEPEPV